jgi:hypothetical protein
MEYMPTGYASDTQEMGYFGQQALAQAAKEQLLEKQVFTPTRKIQAILEAGTIVDVNHIYSCAENTKGLSKFLVNNATTVHTYSYCSVPQAMKFNCLLTTSEDLNNIRIQKMYARSEMECLSSCMNHEVDADKHQSLSIIYSMVERKYQELDRLSQATDENTKTFTCRHLSLAHVLDIIEVANINIVEFFTTSNPDAICLTAMYDKLEDIATTMQYNILQIAGKNFNENITIGNLIDWQKELNVRGMYALDDAIEQVLSCVKTQSRHQKLGAFAIRLINEKVSSEANVEKKQQRRQAYDYLFGISKRTYPIANKSFEYIEDKLSFCCSCFSVTAFIKSIHETCEYIYNNRPINYEEKYLILTVNHLMVLKIKHEQDGLVIKFYNPNRANEKIICITHGDYAKEITISDFLSKEQLELYGILLNDNYDLPTISCIKAIDLHSQ